MEKLGSLTAKDNVVTVVDSEITEESINPIATSAVYQLSVEFNATVGNIS